jgi:hypothetical protein
MVEEAVLDTLGRYKPRQNPTGASLPKTRRDLARARRLMLALQIDEAIRLIGRLELQIDDVPPANARRLHEATELLRAAGFALQDDSLAALPIAVSLPKKGGTTQDNHAALTLCRVGFWRLGAFNSFHLLPRLEPRPRWSKSLAISAMLDLSIEAAAPLDHLRMSTARRLALDALNIEKSTPTEAAGLATIPACVAAQVLYEEGRLDQADTLLCDRLPEPARACRSGGCSITLEDNQVNDLRRTVWCSNAEMFHALDPHGGRDMPVTGWGYSRGETHRTAVSLWPGA